MKRVLIIWDRMGDYHFARVREIKKLLGNSNVCTADLGAKDTLYKWDAGEKENNHFVLSSKSVEKFDLRNRLVNYYKILRDNKIDVIAQSGYGKIEYILFLLMAKGMRKKVILFAESWYQGKYFFDLLKGIFLKIFVDQFFVSGVRAKDHFVNRLKVSEEKIITGYSAIDNEHFAFRQSETESLDDLKPYLLCVARYSEEKNIKTIIECFKQSDLHDSWNLVIIGDGPQKDLLSNVTKGTGKVHLMGWKKFDLLPNWYQNAEAFVLPSIFEPWGLVVNEAMAAGLPVMISDKCGCTDDLMPDHRFIFNPIDKKEIILKMNELYSLTKEEKAEIGLSNKKRVSHYDVTNWADQFMKMIN